MRRGTQSVRRHLDLLLAETRPDRIEQDPVGIVHEFTKPLDQEVVGLLCALLAFGNIVSVRRSVRRVLAVLGPQPSRALAAIDVAMLEARLDGFVHRVYRAHDVATMLARAASIQSEFGSVGDAFVHDLARSQGDVQEAVALFGDRLRGPSPSRSLRHLVPDARKGSACKRLLLLLRWMIRPADGIDLGLWPVSPTVLRIPVDTHVHRIASNLGLGTCRSASWKAAEEITSALRAFDATDPVKYDFALCHFGVSRRCPSRRDPQICKGCVVRTICRHWKTTPTM